MKVKKVPSSFKTMNRWIDNMLPTLPLTKHRVSVGYCICCCVFLVLAIVGVILDSPRSSWTVPDSHGEFVSENPGQSGRVSSYVGILIA